MKPARSRLALARVLLVGCLLTAPADAGEPASRPAAALPTAQEWRQLLGTRLDAPQVRRVLQDHMPNAAAQRTWATTFLVSRPAGIELDFARPTDALRGVVLYNEGGYGYGQYRGALPLGVTFADRRRDVQRKLGRPDPGMGRADRVDWSERGLSIKYAAGGDAAATDPIDYVILHAPSEPDPRPATRPYDPAAPRLAFRLVKGDAAPDDPSVEWLADVPTDHAPPAMLAVRRAVLLDESDVAAVFLAAARDESPEINLTMTRTGAERLADLSGRNVGRRVAIVFDGHILLAPRINAGLSTHIMISFAPDTDPAVVRAEVRDMKAALDGVPIPPATRPAARP